MDFVQKRLASGLSAYYRQGSTDELVLHEVLDNRIYRRAKMGFDVESGENWLDLGANIGAFALYCKLRGATAECYEPDPDCFALLGKNVPDFTLHNVAVTASTADRIPFWKGRSSKDFYRATACGNRFLPRHPSGLLSNRHGGFLVGCSFDGVKMDIEGSEGALLDQGLLPRCRKLCVEYHLSRDDSAVNLQRRLDLLRLRFRTVKYPPYFDHMIALGRPFRTFHDRVIFCMT